MCKEGFADLLLMPLAFQSPRPFKCSTLGKAEVAWIHLYMVIKAISTIEQDKALSPLVTWRCHIHKDNISKPINVGKNSMIDGGTHSYRSASPLRTLVSASILQYSQHIHLAIPYV